MNMEDERSGDLNETTQGTTKPDIQYKVDQIVDSRTDENGKTEYKARCVMYNWLSDGDLVDYQHLIKKYWSTHKKQTKTVKRKRKTQNPSQTQESQDNSKGGDLIVLNEKVNSGAPENTSLEKKEKTECFVPKRSKRLKENDERLPSFFCKLCEKSFRTEDIFTAHMLDHGHDSKLDLSKEIFQVYVTSGKKKEYKCLLCLQLFREKRDAISHQRVHGGTNPWFCEICNKHFLRKYKYTRHVLMHAGTKDYVCEDCGKRFNGPDYLKRHQTTFCCADKGRFKCEICEEVFGEKRLLEAHVDVHNGTNPFYCSHCKKYFLRKTTFEQHMNLHEDCKQFQCTSCTRNFASQGDLNRHQKSHEEELYVCVTCHEVYNLQEDLEMHYQMSESCLEVICTECNAEFPCVSDLRNHLQSYASTTHGSDDNSNDDIYLCRFCQRGFHVQSTFLQHRPVHVCLKRHTCENCDANFATHGKLTDHIKSVHGIATFLCSTCGKVFDDDEKLKKHTKTAHTKETAFRCLPCEKVFYSRAELARHVQTKQHTKNTGGELTDYNRAYSKKFKCSICERVFPSSSELKRHEFVHQRVDFKFHQVMKEPVADGPASPAIYFDASVYDNHDVEQIILQNSQDAPFLSAKLNMDASGNIELIYVNEDDTIAPRDEAPSQSYEGHAEVSTSATADDVSDTVKPRNADTVCSDSNTNYTCTQQTNADDNIGSTATVECSETCNDETFLALSQMVQQGKIDISSLQVIETADD